MAFELGRRMLYAANPQNILPHPVPILLYGLIWSRNTEKITPGFVFKRAGKINSRA